MSRSNISSLTKKLLFNILGFLFTAIGAVGRFVPLVPTTPFILLAAICFSKGNQKIYNWLRKSPFFGPYIENYRTKQGISRLHKAVSISLLWIGLVISMIRLQTTWAYFVLIIVGIGVTVHLLMIKTRKDEDV
ncbi:MAG: YbaN family protein [Defluviitaleaceae bacterium]|nr:YbaN family protein [Defluviitaleaceae bacterium]